MTALNKSIGEKIKNNKDQILICLVAVIGFMLIAHFVGLFNNTLSHDSMQEFDGGAHVNSIKIQAGRIFVPAYRKIFRPDLTVTWVIGMLFTIWMGISVFFVTKIFNIKTKVFTVLTAGILVTNQTIISLSSTYIHDLDYDAFACMVAIISVFLWQRYNKKAIIPGAILVALSIGLYQSYISVVITLILIVLTMQLFYGEKSKNIIKKGLIGAVIMILGGVIYFIALKIVRGMFEVVPMVGKMLKLSEFVGSSITELLQYFCYAYLRSGHAFLTVVSFYPTAISIAFHVIMLLIAGFIVVHRLFKQEMATKEVLLTIGLIVAMPLGMNISAALTCGMSHDVMHFSVWFIYLFILLIIRFQYEKMSLPGKKGVSITTFVLMIIVLWSNVCVSNTTYLKKKMEHDTTLSFFTRVVSRMELTEGYIFEETPVIFLGEVKNMGYKDRIDGFKKYYEITGNEKSNALGTLDQERFAIYFNYILNTPIEVASKDERKEMRNNEEVKKMPVYPHKDSIKMVDGYLVVKLGE